MPRTDTVVIGGGQAGLATSWHLSRRGVDHVVLERGRVANSWSTERWDSLRMITPNWMSRLPGWSYHGPDPDGFMTTSEVAGYLRDYRRSFDAPVHEGVEVLSVSRSSARFEVSTPGATWTADDVVIATGATGRPHLPASASGLAPDVTQLPLRDYRRPEDVPDGGVLVVGASASGVAVAEELTAAGRDVVLSVGSHVWLPRELGGRDIWWWMRESGWLSRTVDDVPDVEAARREPRVQLTGRRGADFGLAALVRRGVTLVGRFLGADATSVRFADDLPATLAQAHIRSEAILGRLSRVAGVTGVPLPGLVPPTPTLSELRLDRCGIRSVIWATGNREHYPWLQVPALDAAGRLVQYRGVTAVPGLYVVGLKFQHRRDATFLDGVQHDARAVVEHLVSRPRPVGVRPNWAAAPRLQAGVLRHRRPARGRARHAERLCPTPVARCRRPIEGAQRPQHRRPLTGERPPADRVYGAAPTPPLQPCPSAG